VRLISTSPGAPLRLGRRRPSAFVALDIGPDAIVALPATGDGARLGPPVVHPLPVGVITDGEVTSAAALAAELRRLFDEHDLPRDVRVGLAHPRLMVRVVELPASLSGQELDAAVGHLAEGLLPMARHEVALDFRRAGVVRDAKGVQQQRILLAAARVDGIRRLDEALGLAGLRPLQVQLSGLAMLRAMDAPPLKDAAVVYVHAGALTNVVIAEDGDPVLVRAASSGSEAIAAAIAERAAIPHDTARERSAAIGTTGDGGEDGALESIVQLQVQDGVRRIVNEIQSSLDYYGARADARPVGAAVLSGPMTAWPGVTAALEQELGLVVLPSGRDGWAGVDTGDAPPERLDVAVGLGLAPASERPDLRPDRGAASEGSATGRVAQAACAVVALLAAAVVYLVIVSNQVTSGHERVAGLGAGLVAAEQRAAALKPYADFAQATATRRQAIAAVAATRFNWDGALRELAQVTPGSVWLTSVKATLAPTTQVDGAGGADLLRATRQTPALQLAGCATAEGRVPDYIDRLRGISGVTDVGFSRSERLAARTKSAAAQTGSAANADCRDGEEHIAQFDLVTFFEPVAALPAATPSAGTAAAPAAGAAAPAAPATAPPNATASSGGTP
jgi:type IV pilus assembly protein PilM